MNGTFVNGQPIQEQRLTDQDRINIGAFELKFDAATRAPFYVEAGHDAGSDITGLIGPDALSAGLHQEIEPAVPPETSIQDRLATLEKENKLLKLLLAVGKTLSSTMTPQEVMQQVMELVFQMENVERGFVMLYDERKGFLPAIVLYKDERQRADPFRSGPLENRHRPGDDGESAGTDPRRFPGPAVFDQRKPSDFRHSLGNVRSAYLQGQDIWPLLCRLPQQALRLLKGRAGHLLRGRSRSRDQL